MATTPAAPDDEHQGDEPAPLVKGQIHHYGVEQPNGQVRRQMILILTEPDQAGAVRGWPLGYEDEAAQFYPHQFS